MSFIVWNARGLGNQRAFRELKRLDAEKDPSLLFISESKMRDYQCRWWINSLGFFGMFTVSCQGRSGGLILLWKAPLDVTVHSYSSDHIDCMVKLFEKCWRFTGFYGNPNASNIHLSWELLRRLSGIQEFIGVSWLVGGDFNEICLDQEKLGGNLRPLHQTQAFWDALDECTLRIYMAAVNFLHGLIGANQMISFMNAWIDHIQELENQIEYLSSKDEIYWKQRSRVNWLAHGDRNSKFLHVCASTRWVKNLISWLLSVHGDWCSDKGGMTEIVVDYFSNLFRSGDPRIQDINPVLDCVQPKVNEQMNSVLCSPFSAEEVKKALFDMYPEKAPGLDGMSAFFFQKNWQVVGPEVLEAVLRIMNDGAPLQEWNETMVRRNGNGTSATLTRFQGV
ncbi:uncharacterized protein LOC142556413 [Primulina tabacum]|uniref:uncharacterized protein LOC142556413 n=1 Tax=Primulina tabacum TaxID=48773 RepID=UPI003F59822F